MDVKDLMQIYFEFVGIISSNKSRGFSNSKQLQLDDIMGPDQLIDVLNSNAEESKTILQSPARIQWEITDICNLNCVHCYIDSNKGSEQLSTKKCIKVVNEIKDNSRW